MFGRTRWGTLAVQFNPLLLRMSCGEDSPPRMELPARIRCVFGLLSEMRTTAGLGTTLPSGNEVLAGQGLAKMGSFPALVWCLARGLRFGFGRGKLLNL